MKEYGFNSICCSWGTEHKQADKVKPPKSCYCCKTQDNVYTYRVDFSSVCTLYDLCEKCASEEKLCWVSKFEHQ